MKSKILLLGILFIFTASQAYSQKCKYDYQKKDPITGEETKGSTFRVVRKNGFWWDLKLNKTGNQYNVGIYAIIGGAINEAIVPKSEINLKLEDGSIITIYANEEYRASLRPVGTVGVVSDFNAVYNISEADMQKLASSPLEYVKMELGTRTYDESLKAKQGKAFQRMAQCMLE